jgi:hypothetical protein
MLNKHPVTLKRKRLAPIWLICYTLLGVTLPLFFLSAPLFGRQSEPASGSPNQGTVRATHVLGLEHVKRGASGTLTIGDKTLRFESGASAAEASIASIQDVFTGEESQQLVRGKSGVVVELAMPYESSRVVSLLASRKIDVLTLEYRDSDGGLHGVIFTLPKGQAPVFKHLLIEHGARTSVPAEPLSKP